MGFRSTFSKSRIIDFAHARPKVENSQLLHHASYPPAGATKALGHGTVPTRLPGRQDGALRASAYIAAKYLKPVEEEKARERMEATQIKGGASRQGRNVEKIPGSSSLVSRPTVGT